MNKIDCKVIQVTDIDTGDRFVVECVLGEIDSPNIHIYIRRKQGVHYDDEVTFDED